VSIQTPAEIETMFRLTDGVAVIYGGVTTYGHRESAAFYAGEDPRVMGTADVVHVARGILPALTKHGSITVGGEALQVNDFFETEEEGAYYTAIVLGSRDRRNRKHRGA
jgi:hypothetical protein